MADTLVVSTRTESGSTGLFLVDAQADGLEVSRTVMVDSRNAANVTFDAVPAELLGAPDRGEAVLSRVLDRGAIALSAEMLGGIQESFDRTLEYLRVREQFGVKIGSFQALKHRAADWFCEVELARSIVLKALRAIDEDSPDLARLASAAKARASDVYIHSGAEGVQLHGGIGMTDEEDIGLYLKRARVAELTLGDGGYHVDRFASLQGYWRETRQCEPIEVTERREGVQAYATKSRLPVSSAISSIVSGCRLPSPRIRPVAPEPSHSR